MQPQKINKEGVCSKYITVYSRIRMQRNYVHAGLERVSHLPRAK